MGAYEKWLKKCLSRFNKKFGDNRKFTCNPDNNYSHEDVVLFDEDSNAFTYDPKIGDVEHGPVYTPWMESKEYLKSLM